MVKKATKAKKARGAPRLVGKVRKPSRKRVVQLSGCFGITWDRRTGPTANYKRLGLACGLPVEEMDVEQQTPPVAAAAAAAADTASPPSLQLPDAREAIQRGGCSRLVEGEKQPKRLTWEEQLYWSALLTRYGSDYEKMQRDRKLNYEQHSAAQCKRMCELYVETCAAPIVPSAVVACPGK